MQYAVPDLAVKPTVVPDDPLYPSQWAPQAIGAPEAWDRTTGSPNVTVALLDSGVSLDHPDLAANLVSGWDFVNNDSDPSDDFGHGTHVAGIIGAAGNNSVGVAGIDWQVSIMPLKICDAQSACYLDEEISALQYAVDHGAKIANASFGGYTGGYQPEEDAIAAAGRAGLLYVAAAGNAELDNDLTPFDPASYPLDNIISVAATDPSGELAPFSNYGSTSVLTAAPGQDILSTMLTSGTLSDPSGYGTLSGTSMAAPEVTGAAALLWAEHPDWTMQQVRLRLLTTASPLAALAGKVADCGQLNVAAATDSALSAREVVCVRLSGTGDGSVTSTPAGIDCGSTCSASVPSGTSLTLSATSDSGSTFEGWGGACSGTGSCTVKAAGLAQVTAVFRRPGSPPGWQQKRLPAPAGRDPYVPGSALEWSAGLFGTFYNVAVSADGSERAETIFNPPSGFCAYAGTDTGGVFLEHHTPAGWVADGKVTAPSVPAWDGDPVARWANCSDFGTVTQLSADGETLLVAPDMAGVWDPGPSGGRYRCAAYVYRRGSSGWALDGILYPPGVGPRGSVTWDGCGYLGIGGAISGDGTRVAMLRGGLDSSGSTVLGADIYVRSQGGWSLEQELTLPSPNADCASSIGPRFLSFSGDGATLLVGSPECDDGGMPVVGLVYAYERSGAEWTLGQTIHSPDPAASQRFGLETALSQDGRTAVIGSSSGAGAWLFEQDQTGWHESAVLAHPGPPYPRPFGCPTIVRDGARVLCSAFDDIGFNTAQGAIYIYDRPSGGWASQSPQAEEAFATDGFDSDLLGQGQPWGWVTLAAPEDGSFIDAPMSPIGLASGAYPHDRVGYEFTTGPVDKTLSVTSAGKGSGSVTSEPTGIDCGLICWHDFADSTPVTLSGTAAAGSTFTGWSGDCSGTGSCTLTMGSDRSAVATFQQNPTLTVTTSGSGAGTVTSSPAGIGCGSTCSHSYAYGTSVTLTATVTTGSTFTGWSGACSGTGTCKVTMDQTRSVAANFALIPETLTVAKKGRGAGRVTSSPPGINCRTSCSHGYDYGSSVTLTAKAAKGSSFAGWSGACTGMTKCRLSMIAARSVRASFLKGCRVPKVRGKRLEAAKRAISAANCRLGTIKHVFSTTARKGHVVSQNPRPHRRLKHGAKVNLVVSRGRR